MSDQRTRSGRTAAPRVTVEVRHVRRQNADDQITDLKNFLLGQDHQPDAELQRADVVQQVLNIMDDELIADVERVLELATFHTEMELPRPDLDSIYNVNNLLKRLRDLQKVRLRDAISAVTRMVNS